MLSLLAAALARSPNAAALARSPGAIMNDLPPCLAATLSPLLSSATGEPTADTDPFAVKMAAASAKAIGETGNYLACTRLVNGTQLVASYALVQFLPSQVAASSHQGPTSDSKAVPLPLFFGACLPRHCVDMDLRREFEHELPRALNATKVSEHPEAEEEPNPNRNPNPNPNPDPNPNPNPNPTALVLTLTLEGENPNP